VTWTRLLPGGPMTALTIVPDGPTRHIDRPCRERHDALRETIPFRGDSAAPPVSWLRYVLGLFRRLFKSNAP
jgi:hypothetical protein